MSKSPFDYINNISTSRNSIWDDESPADWNSFMVTRGLSMYPDTILYAQVMNENAQYALPKMQYDFFRTVINNKKKRFAKWHKASKRDDIRELSEFYGLTTRRLEQYLSIMSEQDISAMAALMYKEKKKK